MGLRHDASLEKYVNALHSVALEQHPTNLTVWSVSWYNSTAVKVTWAFTYFGQANASSNQSKLVTYQESFVMTNFFGAKAASAYVGSINSNSTYKLMNTTYGGSGAYERAFGHPASTFAEYKQEQGPVGNFIWQLDQFVQVGSLTRTLPHDGVFVEAPHRRTFKRRYWRDDVHGRPHNHRSIATFDAPSA